MQQSPLIVRSHRPYSHTLEQCGRLSTAFANLKGNCEAVVYIVALEMPHRSCTRGGCYQPYAHTPKQCERFGVAVNDAVDWRRMATKDGCFGQSPPAVHAYTRAVRAIWHGVDIIDERRQWFRLAWIR